MTTDYLKQKGFSENGEVRMSFQELVSLLDNFKYEELPESCDHYFAATPTGYLPCEFCGIGPAGTLLLRNKTT